MVKDQPRNAELLVLQALKNAISLKAMGCRFDRGLTGTVCVNVAGSGIGAWWYENGYYSFARVAHQTPELNAQSVDEVVTMTRSLASSYFMDNHQLVI